MGEMRLRQRDKDLETEAWSDMDKVASMQALLADNFSENCGHFWINNDFLTVFTH